MKPPIMLLGDNKHQFYSKKTINNNEARKTNCMEQWNKNCE
jgi:hypothetical protein